WCGLPAAGHDRICPLGGQRGRVAHLVTAVAHDCDASGGRVRQSAEARARDHAADGRWGGHPRGTAHIAALRRCLSPCGDRAAAVMAALHGQLAAAIALGVAAYCVLLIAFERIAFPDDFAILRSFVLRLTNARATGTASAPRS